MEPAGRALEPAGRASEPAGRTPGPAGRSLEPAGRALEPAKRASEPAGRSLEPAGRALEPAGRPGASWEGQLRGPGGRRRKNSDRENRIHQYLNDIFIDHKELEKCPSKLKTNAAIGLMV